MCFWAAALVLFCGAGLLLGAVWPAVRHYQDTVLLIALAAACFVNFHRNRTLHCVTTGPLFLAEAIAKSMSGLGWRLKLRWVFWVPRILLKVRSFQECTVGLCQA